MAIRIVEQTVAKPVGRTSRAPQASKSQERIPRKAPKQAAAAPQAIETTARRGRPASGKTLVTLRLDPEVIAKFKATGPGWQARMNDVLAAAKVG